MKFPRVRQARYAAVLAMLFLVAAVTLLGSPAGTHGAPTFTVNSNSDVVASAPLDNGVCQTAANNSTCTLRAAIMKANHYPGGGVTIVVPASASPYTVTIPASGADDEATGDLNITSDMSINGADASSTIIDGNGGVTNDRVFRIMSVTASISGVTVQNGNIFATGFGGGILDSGALTLSNSIVKGNNAGIGGGIDVDVSSTLLLTSTTISSNTSRGGNGGGIFSDRFANTVISNTTISGNMAKFGGGITSRGTQLIVTNSTVSGNSASVDGGGVYTFGDKTTNWFNVTIADNQADADLNGSGSGGGVFNGSQSTFYFQNSIIGGNFETALECPPSGCGTFAVPGDCSGNISSQGHSIITYANVSYCSISGSVAPVDPKLGPLQNNGGPTETQALQPGSPAIDAGNPSGCRDGLLALLTTDQRSYSRPVDGGTGNAYCDIGAFEYLGSAPPTPTASPSPTPSPTPTPTPTPPSTPSPTPTTTTSASATATSTATATVTPTPSATPSTTLAPGQFLWGDVLCIGSLRASDALDELLYAGGLIPLAYSNPCRALGTIVNVAGFSPHKWGDLNCDGQITSADALDALTHPAGLPQLPKTGNCPDIGSVVTIEP